MRPLPVALGPVRRSRLQALRIRFFRGLRFRGENEVRTGTHPARDVVHDLAQIQEVCAPHIRGRVVRVGRETQVEGLQHTAFLRAIPKTVEHRLVRLHRPLAFDVDGLELRTSKVPRGASLRLRCLNPSMRGRGRRSGMEPEEDSLDGDVGLPTDVEHLKTRERQEDSRPRVYGPGPVIPIDVQARQGGPPERVDEVVEPLRHEAVPSASGIGQLEDRVRDVLLGRCPRGAAADLVLVAPDLHVDRPGEREGGERRAEVAGGQHCADRIHGIGGVVDVVGLLEVPLDPERDGRMEVQMGEEMGCADDPVFFEPELAEAGEGYRRSARDGLVPHPVVREDVEGGHEGQLL